MLPEGGPKPGFNMGQITDVAGIRVGHQTEPGGKTGCTVILCEPDAVAGVDVRGSAPGTVEIEVLKPVRLVPRINGIFFTGGSALGLPAVQGVQKYLQEKHQGYDTVGARIPIVPGAVIYDIVPGSQPVIPSAEMAYQAALGATDGTVEEGGVGAGAGATVANLFGPELTRRGGVGSLSGTTADDITVGVLVVTNPFGGIFNPWENRWLAGKETIDDGVLYQQPEHLWESNTTLIAVATDAQLTKEQCIKVAQMAQDGLARVIIPSHSMFDGDLSIALALGEKEGDINGIGHLAAQLTSRCILRAVELSNTTGVKNFDA